MVERILSDEDYDALMSYNPIPDEKKDDKITRCLDCKWVIEEDGYDNLCKSPKRCRDAINNLKIAWRLIRENDPMTMYDRIDDASIFESLRESMAEIALHGLPIPECPFNQKCFEGYQEGSK